VLQKLPAEQHGMFHKISRAQKKRDGEKNLKRVYAQHGYRRPEVGWAEETGAEGNGEGTAVRQIPPGRISGAPCVASLGGSNLARIELFEWREEL
jgi:hypothetical protein